MENSVFNRRRNRFKTFRFQESQQKIKKYWRRLRIFALVIGSFQLTLKHIVLYGTNKPTLDCKSDSFPTLTPKKNWVLSPKSLFQSIWNLIIILVLLYSTIILPYQLAFNEFIGNTWEFLDEITDILYITDIIIHLNTAITLENGKLSYNRKQIFLNYLKSWLIIDVISSFPLKRLAQLIGQENKNSFNKFFRFLKINRVYRISKLFKILNSQKISYKASNFFQAFVMAFYVVLTLFLSIHILACFWYYISDFNEEKYISWDPQFVNTNIRFEQIYLVCVYYVFVTLTTVGYGDIVPLNNTEKLYSMFLMIFGAGFYSFMVSGMINILKDKVKSEQILKEKLRVLKELQTFSKIPTYLYKKIKLTLKVQASNTHPYKFDIYNQILSFPPSLKNEVFQCLFNSIINEINFLSSRPQNFSFFITPNLNLSIYKLNQVIYEENEIPDEFYIIRKGTTHLEVLSILVRICLQGDYFGECELLEDCLRKTSATVCSKVAEIYSLSKKLFIQSLENFPEVKNEIIEVAKARQRKSETTKSFLQSATGSGKGGEDEVSEHRVEVKQEMFRVDTGVAVSLLRNNTAKKKNRTLWAKANGKEIFGGFTEKVFSNKQSLSFDEIDNESFQARERKRYASDGGVLKRLSE